MERAELATGRFADAERGQPVLVWASWLSDMLAAVMWTINGPDACTLWRRGSSGPCGRGGRHHSPLQVSSALVLAVCCCHTGGMTSPIIVTAALPPEIFSYANGLRNEHFPPERNYLSAHLTLFHALPPSVEPELRGLMADLAREFPPPPARMNRIVSLGRGTALGIESDALMALRDRIAERFAGCLTPQDNHRPRLHVTVQNKVSPEEARTLQAQLSSGFTPREFTIPALEAHYYRGGPWEEAGRWPLRGRPAQSR